MISEVKTIIHTCHVATKSATAASTASTWQTSGHGSLFIRGGPRHGPPHPPTFGPPRRSRGVPLSCSSRVHGLARGGAAVGAVAHPAAGALGEVVVHPSRAAGAGKQ